MGLTKMTYRGYVIRLVAGYWVVTRGGTQYGSFKTDKEARAFVDSKSKPAY